MRLSGVSLPARALPRRGAAALVAGCRPSKEAVTNHPRKQWCAGAACASASVRTCVHQRNRICLRTHQDHCMSHLTMDGSASTSFAGSCPSSRKSSLRHRPLSRSLTAMAVVTLTGLDCILFTRAPYLFHLPGSRHPPNRGMILSCCIWILQEGDSTRAF